MKNNQRREKILALIQSNPNGITRRALHNHVHCHYDTLRLDLHHMRDAGLIGVSSGGGRYALWTTVDRLAEVTKGHQSRMKGRKQDVDPVQSARSKRGAVTRKLNAAKKAEGLPQPGKAPDDMPVHAIRPAGTWTATPRVASTWIPL